MRQGYDPAALTKWEHKLWNSSDYEQLIGFRQLLYGDPSSLHKSTSRIDVEKSGIDTDAKRYEDEARGLFQAGFLTAERHLEQLKQGDHKQLVIPQD